MDSEEIKKETSESIQLPTYKIMIDNIPVKEKPENAGIIINRLNAIKEVTIPQLFKYLSLGYTVRPGILNGTTNYILTKMDKDGSSFEEVLKDAQEKGYAERNPEADVEGYDACRKIAILSSLISGQQVDFEDIYCEGITEISVEDMKYAKAMGTTIKLLASSKRHAGNRLHAIVAPCMLYPEHPLYNVNGVFNSIFVHGNVLGDAMFYGSGAGKLPTASAVVADVVDAAKHLNRNIMTMWKQEKLQLEDKADAKRRFFVRIRGNEEELLPRLRDSFGEVEVVRAEGLEGEFGFVTPVMMEGDYVTRANIYRDQILHMIRVEG